MVTIIIINKNYFLTGISNWDIKKAKLKFQPQIKFTA